VFLGHSNGALVAFEFARRLSMLRRRGPRSLIASGRGGPGRGPRRADAYLLSDAELVAELRHYGGTHADVLDNPELLELVLPALRADLEISATTLAPKPEPLACRMVVVAGREDPDVSLEDLEAWAPWAGAGLHCELVEGGHFYLWSSERFATLLSAEVYAA
jgi:surfactin synthase thioesterase subunit